MWLVYRLIQSAQDTSLRERSERNRGDDPIVSCAVYVGLFLLASLFLTFVVPLVYRSAVPEPPAPVATPQGSHSSATRVAHRKDIRCCPGTCHLYPAAASDRHSRLIWQRLRSCGSAWSSPQTSAGGKIRSRAAWRAVTGGSHEQYTSNPRTGSPVKAKCFPSPVGTRTRVPSPCDARQERTAHHSGFLY